MDTCKVSLQSNNTVYVKLPNQILLETATMLREQLFAYIEKGSNQVVLDFTHVHHLDSAGIGILLVLNKRVNESGGSLTVVHVSEQVKGVLERTKFNKIFEG